MKSKLISLLALFLLTFNIANSQTQLSVGEKYQCFIEDFANKSYDWINISWEISSGLHIDFSGTYVKTVSFQEYKSGTYSVTAKWTETKMSDPFDPFRHKSHTWYFTCKNSGPISVTNIKLNYSILVLTTSSIQLSATISPNNATNKNVKWSSSNANVATVSSSGLVSPVSAGDAIITCEAVDGSRVKTACQITVLPTYVDKITLNTSSVSLSVDEGKQLSATISPSNATNKSVTWSSSNSSVATVSSSGYVTAKGTGTATITCKAADGSGKYATCSVTVKSATVSVTSISLNASSASLSVGGTKQLSETISPSNATNMSVTWSSSNTNVATVSDGLVTAVGEGKATITCTANDGSGKQATCDVTVEPKVVNPTSITVSPSSKTIMVGETFTVTYTITPSNATTTVTWTSDDKSIATVSSSGEVKGIKAGSTYINAETSNGKTSWCMLTVESKTADGIEINATNFPDANFRNYLLAQDYGKDEKLTESEIKGVTKIDVSDKNIKSLKGIEYFTALTTLYCHRNQLTSLDVSKNTSLNSLGCSGNKLTSLNVSNNTALSWFNCVDNQITQLDVSKNTALNKLYCSSNQLSALDVSKNVSLNVLYCSGNIITSLDVSKNTALTELRCEFNQLTSLDVSKNTALIRLDCDFNRLTSLDVSKNKALNILYCETNQIKGKAMDDLIGSLPITSSGEFYVFDSTGDGNVCTKSQVAKAKSKGWIAKYWDGTNYADYEGSDEESNIELADGQRYYLKNKANGLFISCGGDWGTHIIVDSRGLDLLLKKAKDNVHWIIETNFRTNISDSGGAIGQEGYVDNYVDTELTIKNLHDNVFSIAAPNGKYLTNSFDNNVYFIASSASSEGAQWEFISEKDVLAQRNASLQNASASTPVDATFLIKDANFNRFDLRIENWYYEEDDANHSTVNWGCSVGDTESVFEIIRSEANNSYRDYTLFQEINLIPGKYKLEAQGFYRDGDYSVAEKARSNGKEKRHAFLFAGDNKVALKSIFDEASSNAKKGWSTKTTHGYIPDTKTEAGYTFQTGSYNNVLEFTVTKESEIRIGVALEESYTLNNWTTIDNFQLTYYGNDNEASLPDMANASDANPVECTDVIKSPSFETPDGKNTSEGWTNPGKLGDDAFQRSALAMEFWQVAINMYQTITGLPAGTYKLTVDAWCRMGKNNENYAIWMADHNATMAYLYAVDGNNTVYSAPIANIMKAGDGIIGNEEFVVNEEEVFYMPNDLVSGRDNIENNEEVYISEVICKVGKDGILTVGIRKDEPKYYSWVVLDNFRLFYLGTNSSLTPSGPATAINDVKSQPDVDGDAAVYSLSGQRLAAPRKGLNIIGRKKVVMK